MHLPEVSVQAYVLSPDNPSFDFMPAGISFMAMFTGTEMWGPTTGSDSSITHVE